MRNQVVNDRPSMTDLAPWGRVQSVIDIGQGICFVTTDDHGGYYVPFAMLSAIPAWQQEKAAQYSGSRHWYEEDCCWAFVCMAYPDLFPPEALEHATLVVHASFGAMESS